MIFSNYVSVGAKKLSRIHGIGYFESGGSIYIPTRGALYFVDKPALASRNRTVRSVFQGKRSQVLHALLVDNERSVTVQGLAAEAHVSNATVSETLVMLEKNEWVSSRGKGPSKLRRLVKPGELLDEWSRNLPRRIWQRERRYYIPNVGIDTIMRDLSNLNERHDTPCVMTLQAAAQRYAPFLTSISQVACWMYMNSKALQTLDTLEARPVSEGANLIITEATSIEKFLFKERVDGVWLASPIQVYLDLLQGQGRSPEMAEHLRRERIGF